MLRQGCLLLILFWLFLFNYWVIYNIKGKRYKSDYFLEYENQKCLHNCRAKWFGETTFATMFLPEYVKCPNFVNADLIAQGLAPFEPRSVAIKAGKLVLQQIHEFANRGVDFAFETTLSREVLTLNYFRN